MAITPYTRLTIGGTIDGIQSWSFGTSWGCSGSTSSPDLVNWLSDVEAVAAVWAADAGEGFPVVADGDTAITDFRAQFYPEDSPVATASAARSVGPYAGGSGAPWPRQTSLAVSLYTPQAGRRGRGRVYLPLTKAQTLTDGLLPDATVTSINHGVYDLLAAILTTKIKAQDIFLCIATPGVSSVAAPLVSQISTDNRPDTQRRRVDKYVGSRQTHSFP